MSTHVAQEFAKMYTRMLNLPALAVVLTLGAAMLTPSQAQAQDQSWLVTPIATRGIDSYVGETFKDLLQNEISARNSAAFLSAEGSKSCGDVPCARKAGKAAGAEVAVFGALNSLGRKVVATITVVDVSSGSVLSNQKMVVDRIEDLDAVATRMATAILGGTNTDETAALGTITKEESKPAQRREGARGLALRVGGMAPVGEGYGGQDAGGGIVLDLSYWFEANDFAIEPRWGLRFDTSDSEASYFEMPLDVGAYYILGRGDFAPFVGGGAGIRFISESRPETSTIGTVNPETNTVVMEDSAWGFGTFARAGVLLFRTYALRIAATVDYNITFVELNETSTPQSLTFGIGVMF